MPEDGGLAFPTHVNRMHGNVLKEEMDGGMTLRQWYAGQALTGVMALMAPHLKKIPADKMEATVARGALRIADALLAEEAAMLKERTAHKENA